MCHFQCLISPVISESTPIFRGSESHATLQEPDWSLYQAHHQPTAATTAFISGSYKSTALTRLS